MRDANFRTFFRLLMAISLLGVVVSTARADAITPSYSVTDLGTGTITATAANGSAIAIDPAPSYTYGQGNEILSAGANGSPILSISNGQSTYAFNLSPATILNPNQPSMANFPLIQPAPVNNPLAYGNPLNAFSVVTTAIENANGIVVATNYAGIDGHYGQGEAYYVQQNSNGTWGLPVGMWTGSGQDTQYAISGGMTVTGINNLNEVLGSMGFNSPYNSTTDPVIYNINTHSLTDVSSYLPTLPQSPTYVNLSPLALDDQGRILLAATAFSSETGSSQVTLLLTPNGLSSDPISAPEPSSWAVLAMALATFAAHRVRERRRRS